MKRLLVIALALMISMSTLSFSSAGNEKYAEKLKTIGVFLGTGESFQLDREPTRIEGIVMFARLLGAKDQALSGDYDHPFTDVPEWADEYVGWAYENGYTKGISSTKFGTGNIDAKSYLTFMLRALGYRDSEGDFTWAEAIDFSEEIGVISEEEAKEYEKRVFLRDDVAKISYDILNINKKNDIKLGLCLEREGSLEKVKLLEMGIFKEDDFLLEEGNVEKVELSEFQKKYDPIIFKSREYGDLEIAEFIKGSLPFSLDKFSMPYTYDEKLHTSKILKHGESDSLYSNEFASRFNGTGVNVAMGAFFDSEKEENLGSVNLRDTGINTYRYGIGEYYCQNFLEYIFQNPIILDNGFKIYEGMSACYVADDIFSITMLHKIEENEMIILKKVIENITSGNEFSEEIADFIVSEVETRVFSKDNDIAFSAAVNNVVYPTEMYVNGYFVEIHKDSGDLFGLDIKIR